MRFGETVFRNRAGLARVVCPNTFTTATFLGVMKATFDDSQDHLEAVPGLARVIHVSNDTLLEKLADAGGQALVGTVGDDGGNDPKRLTLQPRLLGQTLADRYGTRGMQEEGAPWPSDLVLSKVQVLERPFEEFHLSQL